MDDLSSLFSLERRSAVVVGAASGIGRAGALGLADFGASVLCCDVDARGAERTAEDIRSRDRKADALALDLLDAYDVRAAAERVGPIDVLVSTPSVNVRKPLLEITDEEFSRVLDLNLRGTFRLLREFGRGMAERGKGSIVVFSSIRSLVVEPGQGVYAATKAGLVQMVRALAAELGPSGVRVNAVAPGAVETPLTEPIRDDPEWYRAYAEKSILGRWARPEELVGAVVYLASDAASFVTGTCLFVDGGWTAADGRFTPPLGSPA